MSTWEPELPPGYSLWDHQLTAVDRVFRKFNDGDPSTLCLMPTGSGKTVFASLAIQRGIHDHDWKTLFIAQRRKLVTQAADTFRRFGFITAVDMAEQKCGVQTGLFGEPDVVVATVQTLKENRLKEISRDKFGLIVIDECFPAGTLIDGKAIDRLKVGDYVRSLNHDSDIVELRPITRIFRSKPSALVRVHLQEGDSVVCTPGHPFGTIQGYDAAIDLEPGDLIRRLSLEDSEDCSCSLQEVRANSGVQRRENAGERSMQSGLLLSGMSRSMGFRKLIEDDGCNKQKACFLKDEAEQSNESPRVSREGELIPQGNGVETASTWRQRTWNHGTSEAHGNGTWRDMGDRSSDFDRRTSASRVRVSALLQDRYCQQGNNDWYRDRWEFPLSPEEKSQGREKGQILGYSRVDHVEILEPGSDGRFGGLCPDGFVYNLEVENNHNYFVGEPGFLVHNCHHSFGSSYEDILEWFNGYMLLGLTATPGGSRRNLGNRFKSVAYRLKIIPAIQQGVICPYHTKTILGPINLKELRVTRGDFSDGELAARILPAVEGIAYNIKINAGERPTVVFTPDLGTASAVADMLRKQGVSAKYIAGSEGKFGMPDRERSQIESEFEHGEFQYIVSCDLLSEGWDCRRVSCVAICRPTMKAWRRTQMIGRGFRQCEGKENLLVLDFDWQTDEQYKELCGPYSLFEDDIDENVKKHLDRKLRSGEEIDLIAEIMKAKDDNGYMDEIRINFTGKYAQKWETVDSSPVGIGKIMDCKIRKTKELNPHYGGGLATESQVWKLSSLGVANSWGMSKWGASKLISKLMKDKEKGLASWQQRRELLKLGVDEKQVRSISSLQAAALICGAAKDKQMEMNLQ